jgi:serpin B
MSLSLVYNGAGGKTRALMADALGFGGISVEELNRRNAEIRVAFEKLGDAARVQAANALCADQKLRIDREFLVIAERFYAAEIFNLNFGSPESLTVINEWVGQKTGGKISSLVKPADLSPATDCILMSAVYFKGLWRSPFDKSATRDEPFFPPGGKQMSVPTMRQTGRVAYRQEKEFQAVRLPYANADIGMYVFLPSADSSVEEFMRELNVESWEKRISGFEERHVEIALPRLKLNFKADLNETLTALGLGIIFGHEADFSPMGLSGHHVDKVAHQAVVEVNEEGTEASAATAVVMVRSLQPPREIIINRPFFWAIQNDNNRSLLFAGVVTDPSDEG